MKLLIVGIVCFILGVIIGVLAFCYYKDQEQINDAP